MRKIIYIFFIFSPYFLFSESLNYIFKKDIVEKYRFTISGNVVFSYTPNEKNNFNVLASGIINIKTVAKNTSSYILEITPQKTFIKVNDAIVEDITKSDTEISRIVSKVKIEMNKNGAITKIEEIKPNIINIGKVLNLIPAFPEEKIYRGKTWQQQVSSFEIPGFLKMCNLKFNYFVSKIEGKKYTIELVANQIIQEKEKDKDITIKFSGTNNSKGSFIFDSEKGKIEKFNSNFKLYLKVFFILPPAPEEKTQQQTLPMDLKINIITNFTRETGN